MKKLFLICLLSSFGLINKSFSQVTITYAADSSYAVCPVAPFTTGFYFEATALGYSFGDAPTFYINFGDGNDTTFTDASYFDATSGYAGYAIAYTYMVDGVYDVTYAITMPDMQTDTVVHLNELSIGTCDSVSGYVYVDYNTNCIFDGTDVPVQMYLTATDNLTGNYLGSGTSDGTGYYSIVVPPATDVIITMDSYSGFNDFVCPISGEILTAAPSSGNDFALNPQVGIVEAADSASTYCFVTSTSVDFGLFAETIGYSPSDVPIVYIDFGDGTNTTLSYTDFATDFPYVYVSTDHTYNSAGVYDVTYVITMPDLAADTVVVYNEVIIQGCEIISGYVYHDMNTNCVFDGSDVPLQLTVMAVEPITYNYLGSVMPDASGYYEILVPSGIPVEIMLSDYFTSSLYVCPAIGYLSTTAPSSGNDFTLNSTGFDITPFSWGGFFHPGFTETISIGAWDVEVLNTPDIQLRIVINDPQVTLVSGVAAGGDTSPDISGDTLTWDIPAAFVTSVYSYSGGPLLVLTFMTDVAAPIGTMICMDVIASPISGDVDQTNNLVNMCFPVANSYDPNYIEVSPHGETAAGLIEPNLDMVYTVHFQNTGNFPAVNVTIKDTLTGNVLDLSSFEYLGSSHPLTNIVTDGNGAMTFFFENIYLPDSTSDEPNSHGWITYRIKQQPNLIPSTTIENTAYIYFDFNAPVITNTALNTIADPLSVDENDALNAVVIYPVPATDLVTVMTNVTKEIGYFITDFNGKVLQQGSVKNGDQISVSTLPAGIYLFQFENGSVGKIVIQR